MSQIKIVCEQCGTVVLKLANRGASSLCKRCYKRTWRQANKDKINALIRFRRANNVNDCKTKEQYYYKKNSEEINRRRLKFRQANKAMLARKDKAWREKNQESIKVRRRKYYRENRERVLELNRQWEQSNPEKVKAYSLRYYLENREKIIERVRVWRMNDKNQEKLKLYRATSSLTARSSLKSSDIPPSVKELKALQMELKRLLREI
jgi:hypothetical protein